MVYLENSRDVNFVVFTGNFPCVHTIVEKIAHTSGGLMARPNSAEAKEDLKQMDLLPCIHITVDLSWEKVRTQQIKPKTWWYHMPNPAYCP